MERGRRRERVCRLSADRPRLCVPPVVQPVPLSAAHDGALFSPLHVIMSNQGLLVRRALSVEGGVRTC